jgi:hypothetical protein
VRQLDAAASDIGVIRRDEIDLGIVGDSGTRFGHRAAADGDLSRQNQRARPLTRGSEASVDDELVEPDSRHRDSTTKVAARRL